MAWSNFNSAPSMSALRPQKKFSRKARQGMKKFFRLGAGGKMNPP